MTEFEYKKYTEDANLDSSIRVTFSAESLLIAAAFHKGGFIPGFFDPIKKKCLIPWNCRAHEKEDFYILHLKKKAGSYKWSVGKNGSYPEDAVSGPYSESGEPLFIGKANINGKLLCGKVHPSHGVLYVPDDGLERNSKTYLVLSANNYNPKNNPQVPQESERVNQVSPWNPIFNKFNSPKKRGHLFKRSSTVWNRTQGSGRLKRLQ